MRYRPRVDRNQSEIVMGLRAAGCQVLSLASIGRGCADILVQYRDKLYLMEIKDGNKPPSHRKLTDDEAEFHMHWKVYIVESIEDSYRVIGAIQ
jgi:hypothetical protein